MKKYFSILVLLTQLFAGNFQAFSETDNANNRLKSPQSFNAAFFNKSENEELLPATTESFELFRYSEKCSSDKISRKIFEEYGSVFVANRSKVQFPNGCFFQNDKEVKAFQSKVKTSKIVIDGITVELQKEALKAFVSAKAEAKKSGLDITPNFEDSSRRSFADTVKLWRDQVDDGLEYWSGKNRLTNKEVSKIRAYPIEIQVIEILKLEENKIYFGNGYKKSILQSVAIPGKSQHNLMLALDIKQFDDPKIRAILAKYGWFQTIRNDAPHFTFLGLKESQLSSAGMRRSTVGRRVIWLVGSKLKPMIILPMKNIPATMSEDVILPLTIEPLLSRLTQKYYAATGKKLHITSGFRTPDRQARAMFFNLSKYGIEYVANTYGRSSAVWEIIRAFQKNRTDKEEAVSEMAKIIISQIKRKIIISPHIREKAFDIRSRGREAADLSVLMKIVSDMRGEVVVEKDHYHVEF